MPAMSMSRVLRHLLVNSDPQETRELIDSELLERIRDFLQQADALGSDMAAGARLACLGSEDQYT